MTTLLSELVKRRVVELKQQILQLKKLTHQPEVGRIKLHQKAGKIYCCIVSKDESGKIHETYVNPDNMGQAIAVNEKQMAGELLKLCLQELAILENYSKACFDEQENKIRERFRSRSEFVVSDCLRSEAELAAFWERDAFESNDYAISETEARITDRGDVVRSKLECLVANRLFAMGLPYRYECRLYLHNGDKIRYPDFTVKSPYTGKIIYIEVFGMMDDPDYAKAAFSRINLYARNGIIIGDNFLPVFEYPGVPFDPQAFTASLNRLLKNPL